MDSEIKSKFVQELGELLERYKETSIEYLTYGEDEANECEKVYVKFKGGGTKVAYVTGDNCIGIIYDLVKQNVLD